MRDARASSHPTFGFSTHGGFVSESNRAFHLFLPFSLQWGRDKGHFWDVCKHVNGGKAKGNSDRVHEIKWGEGRRVHDHCHSYHGPFSLSSGETTNGGHFCHPCKGTFYIRVGNTMWPSAQTFKSSVI